MRSLARMKAGGRADTYVCGHVDSGYPPSLCRKSWASRHNPSERIERDGVQILVHRGARGERRVKFHHGSARVASV